MANIETRVELDALELEFMESYLPTNLTLRDRCDGCGAQALHAFVVSLDGVYKTLLMCNHHGREAYRSTLKGMPHRDYRMPLAEAEKIDATNQAAALASKDLGAEFRAYPRHLTQWDMRYWS